MPRRPLPTLALSVGLAVVLIAVLRPARGQDADPKGHAPAAERTDLLRVRVDRTDGSSVTGTLRLGAIGLKTETDTRDIDVKHVRRVTFQREPGGQSQDTVQLDDKSVVRGRVLQVAFEVQADDGVRVLKNAELREIRVVREERVSLTTVLLGLLTLAAMEIVLGIDNIIFLAIVAGKLPEPQQPRARRIGLIAALGTRLLLLFTLSFLLGLTRPLFTLPDLPLLHDLEAREVSWRDLILLGGGLFLIGKSVREMHEKLEEARAEQAGQAAPPAKAASFAWTIVTIAGVDIIFSLDSVITAVGMVEQLWVMVVAMVIAMLVMLWFSGPISRFVEKHPTIKVLALSFLILIGVMLVAEGLGQHIDKGYIYFAMAFAVGIEMINMRLRKAHRAAASNSTPGNSST
jgi:predicted tellurium resistance membrane protein TerC